MLRRDPLHDPASLIRRVYAYVAYRIGDGPDAQDITSETFERALRYRQKYDPSRGEPISWLLGIARRVIADSLAKRTELSEAHAEGVDSDDLGARVVQRLSIADAVGELDERERELIALRYGADLTARQIGTLVGLRTNTVEVSLHRARERLRARLGDERAGEEQRPIPRLQGDS